MIEIIDVQLAISKQTPIRPKPVNRSIGEKHVCPICYVSLYSVKDHVESKENRCSNCGQQREWVR